MLNVLNVMKITQKYVGDFTNGYFTIVGRVANLTCSIIPYHKNVSFEDFCILQSGYANSKFKGRISEELFIKELPYQEKKLGKSD